MADGRLLAIYLNDHLAGSALARELAKRALRENRDTSFGAFLERFIDEVEEDAGALETIIESLGIKKSRGKRVAAIAAERIGRLKLNGQITGYSPLSRVLELEGLTMGVQAKLALWRNLRDAMDVRAEGVDLDVLISRAERQLAALAEQHVSAAHRAFAANAAG